MAVVSHLNGHVGSPRRVLPQLVLASLLVVLNCPLASPADVANKAAQRDKSVRLQRTAQPPVLDGRLDDSVWAQAAVVADFHEVNPNEFASPGEETKVYLLYDDDALYVGARMYDGEPDEILANVLVQGATLFSDDQFSLMLDPFNQGRGGYIFQINPNGIRAEALFANTTTMNWDWTGIWHGKATIDGEGWVAEIAIPFKSLSFDPELETWGINFARFVTRRREWLGWVSYNRTQDPTSFGRAHGMNHLEQGKGLDVVPSVAIRERKDFAGNTSAFDVEPAIDVFYKLTPALTASLTANPDFSGTDVDERQINLTRFGLFFAEKRDFFLQDADIFEFARLGAVAFAEPTTFAQVDRENGRPFFSRRIGLSETGEAVDLQLGGKLTGRIGRFDLGLLDIQQDSFGTVDETNLFVGRAAANVLAESSLGLIITNGDPGSNFDNTLVGTDFRYLNTRLGNGRVIEGALWYQQSNSEDRNGSDAAYGVSLKFPNNGGLRGGLDYREVQANFNPALGFVNRTDVRQIMADVGYIHRPASNRFRKLFTGVDLLQYEDLDGNLQTRTVTLQLLDFENRTSDRLKPRYITHQEVLVAPFEIFQGIVIPTGTYSFDEYGLELATGNQRILAGSFSVFDGDFFDGVRTRWNGQATWRPSKHFNLALKYQLNRIALPQGSFTARLMETSVDLAFTATWSWENFIQYDNVSDSIGINSILRWIPVAGREAVLVVNRTFQDRDENWEFRSRDAELALKVGYTFRF